MRRVVAMILAGGQGERLNVLSRERAKPAVPFAGKYRIIDFTLSNCVNSGIYDVAVLTQYRPHSLNDHIGIGRPWDLDRTHRGVRLLQPFLGRRDSDWYRGTADAVHQNLQFVSGRPDEMILILSGDHIYRMDYRGMLEFHEANAADATVAVFEVPLSTASRFGTLVVDENQRITSFDEKPRNPRSNLVSMGVYVFDHAILEERLAEDAATTQSHHDFGQDIIPSMVGRDRVYAFRFSGYWRDVGTVESYWDANMALVEDPPEFDLYDPEWVIHTRSEERPPARVLAQARVGRSLISHGCTIYGTVQRSVLSPGVTVGDGALVRDSILMTDTVIEPDAVIERSIIDKEVVVGRGAVVGYGDANVANRLEARLNAGITIVGKRAQIPAGIHIGRNCIIDAGVDLDDFEGATVVPSGESIMARVPPSPVPRPEARQAAS
jgi:glucose-1-phosphate adenylyltransferase